MAFENQVFEQRVAQTISTLGKLDSAVKSVGNAKGLEDIEKSGNKVTLNGPMSALDKLKAKLSRSGEGAAQGFSDIEKASSKVTLDGANKAIGKTQSNLDHLSAADTFSEIEKQSGKVSLQGLASALDSVTQKFSILQGAAAVAFGNIATQAISKGTNFAKGFGVQPILDGLEEYQTNLKSIQVIQANTDQPLTKINASLNELNHYSDQTIYNFSEMARNIGTFTAAGVDLKTATSSIKGIANLAALSGSSSQQAATAMYQLSQAIASGKVGLQDWNSVVNAGMGGKKLQNALAQTAIAMGQIKESSVKLSGPMKKLTINGESFRESIQAKPGSKPWLTSEVLVNSLATLDGRFSKAALSAELTKDGLKKYTEAQIEAKIADNRAALEKKNGVKYTDAQFASLQKLSDSAFKSATEVKTLGQVFDVAKETIGSGWSASFQSIFGTLTEAKKTFTGMSNAINGFINANALARNTVLHDWKAMGGRTELIAGIKQAFQNLFAILKPIKDAFRDIFPAKTGKDLFAMTKGFADLMQNLKPSAATIENLQRTFRGFFAIVHIGWTVVKELASTIFDLLGVVGKGSGGFLSFTGGIGDFATALDQALTKGGLIKSFFETLGNALKTPLQYIMGLAHAFLQLFGIGQSGEEFGQKVGKSLENIPDFLRPIAPYLQQAADAWHGFIGVLKKVGDFIQPWVDKFKTIASDVGDAIVGSFSQANFDNVIKAVQTGLLGGLFFQIKKMMSDGIGVDVGGGFLKSMGDTFKALTGNLQAMQKNVQASALLKIASALGLLAAAAYVFSSIPADKLGKAMGAMVASMGQLVAVMAVMAKVGGGKGILALPSMATSLLILAAAMVVLAGAVKLFASMKWEELGRGLAGIAGGLAVMAVALKLMPPGSIVQGAVLIAFALGLNALAVAVKQLAGLSWEDLGKGLLGIAVGLGLVIGATLLMPPNMAVMGLGMMAMAAGVTVLAGAIAAMGRLDVATIAKGIAGIALTMVALAWAITGFPPTLPLQAAGLILVGIALKKIGEAVGVMGGLSIWKLIKGIAALAIVLTELAVGLYLMVGSAPGAVALLAAASALAILGPAMAIIGNLDILTIVKALATMAVTMGLLAAAGVVLAAPLALIGVALAVLGVGLLPVALSAMLLAKAFQILGAEGAKGLAVLVGAVGLFIASIPKMIVGFLQGIGDVLATIAELAPKIAIALGVVINALLFALAEAIPKAALVISRLLTAIVTIISQHGQPLIQAGIGLLLNLLNGISQNISRVVQTASDIVVKFLDGLRANAGRLTSSGLSTMVAFLQGISTGIPRIVNQVANMVAKFLSTVTSRLPGLVTKGAEMVVKFIEGVSGKIGDIVAAGARFVGKFLIGIGNAIPDLVDKGLFVARKFLNGVADGMVGLAHIGFNAIIKFLNGLEREIRNNSDDLINAGIGVGDAIFDGVAQAIDKAAGPIIEKLKWVFSKLPGPVKKVLGIHSPSTVFAEIGKNTMEGFSKGVLDNRSRADQSATIAGTGAVRNFSAAVMAHRTEPARQFREVGRQSVEGLNQGLKESSGGTGSILSGIAGGMVQSLKDVLQIRSPSRVLKDIGKDVGRGFRDGIDGSKEDIRSAFRGLHDQLNNELRSQRDDLKQENQKMRDLQQQHADKLAEINKLKKHPVRNAEEIQTATKDLQDINKQIDESQKSITAYNRNIGYLTSTRRLLTGSLQTQKKELVDLSKDLEATTKRLEQAQAVYDDVLKSYSELPDTEKLLQDALSEAEMSDEDRAEAKKKKAEDDEKRRRINQVANYKKALQDQIEATRKYQETLTKLRELGLDDVTYKKLLAKGVEGQEFATQLAATGKEGVAELNKLDSDLSAAATGLADDAARSLYGAGLDAAQGVIDGLKAKQKDIQNQMDQIADAMVRSIKQALGIRSPSKVFAELGRFTMAGFVQGVDNSAASVKSAAKNAVDAAKDAFSSLQTDGLVDIDPTIKPVLDLSQVEKDAQKLGDLTNVTPITAAASFGQASAISDETAATAAAATEASQSNVTQVSFEQNNYSPEALSDIEIYRKTNNQLSQVRSALGLPS